MRHGVTRFEIRYYDAFEYSLFSLEIKGYCMNSNKVSKDSKMQSLF